MPVLFWHLICHTGECLDFAKLSNFIARNYWTETAYVATDDFMDAMAIHC